MKKIVAFLIGILMITTAAYAAYHHEGEMDAGNFLAAYPDKAGTKLDHCALCHSGGQYVNSKDKLVTLGSCQWCHYSYGYDGSGDILETINPFGAAYMEAGRDEDAFALIEDLDSDEDGFSNADEIAAERFPGDANDNPPKETAPFRIFTRGQLEAMPAHTQFMLMNTSRSGDFYVEYTGVPMAYLLDASGMLPEATGITVFAPDGWSQYHPLQLDQDPELYHVYGNMPDSEDQYPAATYQYDPEAELWCDYSAPSCVGRQHNDPVFVENGLKAILAYKREGADLDKGILSEENKLDGEGPFRVVVPQKSPNPPDQSSKAEDQNVLWPYTEGWDHNAGACTRSATIIRVEPLPEGKTDIDLLEAGWSYVDQEKIIVYGAIDGTDSNGNGILDSEEGTEDTDGNGIPDFKESNHCTFQHTQGAETVHMIASGGAFANVVAVEPGDPALPQVGKPEDCTFPYGAIQFDITDIAEGDSVTVTLVFPGDVPTTATYYKISEANGWKPVEFGSNDGDNTITITLTDGDPLTDADGVVNGRIVDPGALGITEEADVDDNSGDTTSATSSGGGGGGDSCFISSINAEAGTAPALLIAALFIAALLIRRTNNVKHDEK